MDPRGEGQQVRRSGAGAGQIKNVEGDEPRWRAVQVGIYKGGVGDVWCVSMGWGDAEKEKGDMT